MKRLFAIITTLFLATLMGGPAFATGNGQAEHVPVNVCHATSSDTNPFVFITVDDDSVKLKGHLMHRDDPNKTWKSDGEWNGVAHLAGDPKADRIESYTGTDGVYHELDGTFTDCGSDTTPPELKPTEAWVDFIDPTCDNEAGISSEYDPSKVEATLEGKVGAGNTVTMTFVPKEGYYLTGDNVNDEGNIVETHTYKSEPKSCDVVTNTRQVRLTCDGFFVRNVEFTTHPDGTVTRENGKWVKVRNATKDEKAELECSTPNNPPKHHNPPADSPPKADTPPAEPELPHTGANLWLAAVGALITGLGAGLVKLTAV